SWLTTGRRIQTLQCSVLTATSLQENTVCTGSGHGSGESHPGMHLHSWKTGVITCKSSSETDSSTQSCVYKLPQEEPQPLSDAGTTYYCAVLIVWRDHLFGNGTKLDFVEKAALDPIILALTASNIISVVVVIFVCSKHSRHNAVRAVTVCLSLQAACEALNLAAGSLNNEAQQMKETDLYSQVIYYQRN
ncbi:hypothetical protein NFI96_031220, partial [Prochilodus magdalenae]